MKPRIPFIAAFLLPAVLTAGCVDFDAYREQYDTPHGQDAQAVYIDATAGGAGATEDDPRNKYTYFNLEHSEPVPLTDAEAKESLDWHMAFKRFNVLLNSGTSGPGDTRGWYTGNNVDLSDERVFALTADEGRTAFDAVSAGQIPSEDSFRPDGLISRINRWFVHDAGTDTFQADPSRAFQIRTGDGMHFVKLHVVGLEGSTREASGRITLEWALSDGGDYGTDRTDSIQTGPGEAVCFDFDAGAESDCVGDGWDLKASGWDLNTNGGDTGTGSGGTIPLPDYAGTVAAEYSPFYYEDLNLSVIMEDVWYRYNEQDHILYPTYYVYLVRTETAVFKVQIVSYYHGGVSGYLIVLFEAL